MYLILRFNDEICVYKDVPCVSPFVSLHQQRILKAHWLQEWKWADFPLSQIFYNDDDKVIQLNQEHPYSIVNRLKSECRDSIA